MGANLPIAVAGVWLCFSLVAGCGGDSSVAEHDAAEGAAMGEAADAGREDAALPAHDCTHILDPAAMPGGDGSPEAPWGTLERVFSSGYDLEGGDVLCLLEGHHGSPRIANQTFTEDLFIVAHEAATPIVSGLDIRNSQHLVIEGLTVDPSDEKDLGLDEKDRFLVVGDEATTDMVFRDISVRSDESISGWTKSDWYLRSVSGLDMRGDRIRVEGSRFENLYHAVSLRGDHSYLGHSHIDNFAGDAIRGLGSFSTYEWNTVRDAYIDDYAIQHDDAFQAYNLEDDPKIEGVRIRNNRIMQFLDPRTEFLETQNLISSQMQGIIITDGYADGWVVENNLVVIEHPIGIVLHGARHCRVQNNTVVASPHNSGVEVPYILLRDQPKTGQENFNNVIRNNLTSKLTPWAYDESSVVEHNIDIDESNVGDYEQHFADYTAQDFALRATSGAVDSGANADASALDIVGNARISGGVVDCGAVEYTPLKTPPMSPMENGAEPSELLGAGEIEGRYVICEFNR